jgi:hypothetical protein
MVASWGELAACSFSSPVAFWPTFCFIVVSVLGFILYEDGNHMNGEDGTGYTCINPFFLDGVRVLVPILVGRGTEFTMAFGTSWIFDQ